MGPHYSVAVCNYNMAETVAESLTSLLAHLPEDAEVVVIDDGSTDGSLDILETLSRDHDSLRYHVSDNDNIAEARNESFRRSRGDYILEPMDTDDRYGDGIEDFVELYHQLEPHVEGTFYLKGKSINMAPRSLQLAVPFRSMTYGEDSDRWRRLFARDKIVWLEHEPFWERINPDDGVTSWRKSIQTKIAEFRSGVTLRSYLRYVFEHYNWYAVPYVTCQLVIPYLIARVRGQYSLPDGYEDRGKLPREIQSHTATAPDLEDRYDFEFDRTRFSERGREIFFDWDSE